MNTWQLFYKVNLQSRPLSVQNICMAICTFGPVNVNTADTALYILLEERQESQLILYGHFAMNICK